MKKIYLVGIGMGNSETLTEQGLLAIERSDLLIGAERMVESFPNFKGDIYYAIESTKVVDYISDNSSYESIAVILSGDVGFFSGAKKLNQLIEEKQIAESVMGNYIVEFIPGISSLQYFCAKLKVSWEDVKVVSLHGREGNVMGAVWNHEKTFFLTGGEYSAARICQILVENDLGAARVHVGERLSYPEERVITSTAEIFAKEDFHPLTVMLIENKKLLGKTSVTHGMEDDLFLRGQVPMTKSEIRSVALSKLRLRPEDVVYDIGAGTGAVAIDVAFQVKEGFVYAVEVNEEAVALINTNVKKLGAWNVKIIHGKAPEVLATLPTPDRAFIGGSKGNMATIIKLLLEKNPKIRIVINAITLETMMEAIECFRIFEFEDIDILQISAARAKEVGNYHMMTGQNPVFIISGEKKG